MKEQEIKSEYKAGERPPEGCYVCMSCGQYTLIVPEMAKRLPTCPECGGKIWMKY